jgi:hypothetical protein
MAALGRSGDRHRGRRRKGDAECVRHVLTVVDKLLGKTDAEKFLAAER